MIELQPAYILHTRPYRDTSMLVDFLTPQHGRVTAVARGVRSRKTPKRNLLNPFTRLLISCQGKSTLQLMTHFEAEGHRFSLSAKHLYSGFYLNELLVRLLPEMDAHEDVYYLYEESLRQLNALQDLEPVLRHFEIQLLAALGYAIDFTANSKSGEVINEDMDYCFDPQEGFYFAEENAHSPFVCSGAHIVAIAERNFENPEVRQTAKKITRIMLRPLLGNKPLMSRELFVPR